MAIDDFIVDFCISKTFGGHLSLWLCHDRFARLRRVVRMLARHCLDILDGSRLLVGTRARFRAAAGGNGAQHEKLDCDKCAASRYATAHKAIPDIFSQCNRKAAPIEGLAATSGCH
jgi:hypothetical protein